MAGDNPRGLLARLAPADREAFDAKTTTRRYRANNIIFHEGDPSDWVLGIESGHVKISASTQVGREVVLAICEPGELLGDLAGLDGETRSATATAMESVTASMLHVDAFHAFLSDHPVVALELLRSLAERLRAADRRRVEYASLDSVGRVASRLVELTERFGTPADGGIRVELPITQSELAGWSGCSVEATTKALRALRDHCDIETARRSITVLDLAALRGRASIT